MFLLDPYISEHRPTLLTAAYLDIFAPGKRKRDHVAKSLADHDRLLLIIFNHVALLVRLDDDLRFVCRQIQHGLLVLGIEQHLLGEGSKAVVLTADRGHQHQARAQVPLQVSDYLLSVDDEWRRVADHPCQALLEGLVEAQYLVVLELDSDVILHENAEAEAFALAALKHLTKFQEKAITHSVDDRIRIIVYFDAHLNRETANVYEALRDCRFLELGRESLLQPEESESIFDDLRGLEGRAAERTLLVDELA